KIAVTLLRIRSAASAGKRHAAATQPMSVMISTPVHVDSALSDWRHGGVSWAPPAGKAPPRLTVPPRRGGWRRRRRPSDHLMLPRWASSSDTVREIKYLQLILPAP